MISRPKIKVAMIGAAQPALAVALQLVACGAEVKVYGSVEKVGVASGAGPRFFWRNEDAEKLWPRLKAYDVVKVDVSFLEDGRLVPNTKASKESLQGYWRKSRGELTGNHPCRGVDSFLVYDGLFSAGGGLAFGTPDDLRQFELRGNARSLTRTVYEDQWIVEGDDGTQDDFDCIVSCLPPIVFARLARSPNREDQSRCERLVAFQPDVVTFTTIPYGTRCVFMDFGPNYQIIYDGCATKPWHRVSTTSDRAQCYESRRSETGCESIAGAKTVKLPTQLSKRHGAPKYPGRVVPVGRFAEWKGDMMTDDVCANVELYVDRVWRAALLG